VAEASPRTAWQPLIAAREPAAEDPPDARVAEDEPAAAPVAAAAAETLTPEATPEVTPDPPPPTPEPTPEPPPPAPAPTGQLTRDAVREIALSVGWPESEMEELLDVAWCESRYRVDANGWGALGLMQIMPFWFESVGIDPALAFDAATNLRVAYHIYQNDLQKGYGEWASWTCKPLTTA
jgi:hypothetical protein